MDEQHSRTYSFSDKGLLTIRTGDFTFNGIYELKKNNLVLEYGATRIIARYTVKAITDQELILVLDPPGEETTFQKAK